MRASGLFTRNCSDLIPSGHLLDYIPRFQLEFHENSCSDLRTSERLLDYIPLRQLALAENKRTVSLTMTENMLGLIENGLRTSAATRIN
jgi:hypothetical protein